MPFEPGRGKTILVPSGTDRHPNKKHLFIILTDACVDGQHLLVSLSRVKEGIPFDDTCVFEPGEHPFVREKSFAAYRLARIETSDHLTKCVDGWYWNPREDMAPEQVIRMCDGVEKSEFIPLRIVKYYQSLKG